MSSFFEKSQVLLETGNGLLCNTYFLKGQLNSDESPVILRSLTFQKLRVKLEKSWPIDIADIMKVRADLLMNPNPSSTCRLSYCF
jgi:hypothetical protein